MAKGNFLLGYARGSVGDVTFSRVKGNQVAKARNRNPANPNTIPQAMQRSLFADAVKFYTRGVQNLFKFAFEGKLENESDYNAFMRLNVNRGVRIGKDNIPMYPALGDWIVSDGSITSPQVINLRVGQSIADIDYSGGYVVNDAAAVEVEAGTTLVSSLYLGLTGTTPTTVGQLSTLMLEKFPQLRNGDFVTVLLISQPFYNPIGDLFPNYQGWDEGLASDPRWDFAQLAIDENNESALSSIYHSPGSSMQFEDAGGSPVLSLFRRYEGFEEGFSVGVIAAGAVIFSRQTASGLLVSRAPLSRGLQWQDAVRISRTQAFEDGVMVTYGAADPSILQGQFIRA